MINFPTSLRPRLVGGSNPNNKGFTLIELLLVMGIIAILSAVVTINLIRPQTKSSLDSTVVVLTADIKAQQLKAMTGNTDGVDVAEAYGIYLETDKYTLFKGSSYSSSHPNNFVVELESNTSFTNNIANSQLVFSRVSGEVIGFVSGANTITISDISGNSKVLTVSKIGTVNIQ